MPYQDLLASFVKDMLMFTDALVVDAGLVLLKWSSQAQ
jgi:hypothetical protein